jgi:hypothetical protein
VGLFTGLAGTKIHETVTMPRMAVATPSAIAELETWRTARQRKAPMKRAAIAATLWSRDLTRRKLKSWGSHTSSHQTVVNTTTAQKRGQIQATEWEERGRTRRRKLRIEALAHDALKTQAGADQAQAREGASVGPGKRAAGVRDAPLTAEVDADGGDHGEQRLDERAEEEPGARLGADTVADAAKEAAANEGQEGRQRELIGEVEGCVARAGRAFEQAAEGDGQL